MPATSQGRPFNFLRLINWSLTKLGKALFGYQFILICCPKR